MTTGPAVDLEFNLVAKGGLDLGAELKGIGLNGGVDLSSVGGVRVHATNVLTYAFPVMDYKRDALRSELERSAEMYRGYARAGELFLLTQSLCAKELVLTSGNATSLRGLVGFGSSESLDGGISTRAQASWSVSSDESIRYKNDEVLLCFGTALEEIRESDIDRILSMAPVCPSDNELLLGQVPREPVPECYESLWNHEGEPTQRAIESNRFSGKCALDALNYLQSLKDLNAAAMEHRQVARRRACSPRNDPTLNDAVERSSRGFLFSLEGARRANRIYRPCRD